jgi:hypothetical protein
MEKHTIGGLKKALTASSDFYDIADYFLTLTETNMAALHGKSGQNKVLMELIGATLVQICHNQGLTKKSESIALVNLMMIEVSQHHFWHGSALINGKFIFTFFYFADLDMGLISVAKGGNNFFARVTIKGVPQKSNPKEEFSDN